MTMQKDSGTTIEMVDDEYDQALCPHCAKPVQRFDHFCPHCHQAITAHASTDPLGQIYAAGNAYGKAVEKPKLIIVIGMWLIFGPQTILISAFLIHHIFENGINTRDDALGLIIWGGFAVLFGSILWRLTTRYLKYRKQAGETFIGYCQQCGYDLRSITSDSCPECGTPIPVT